MKNIDDLLNKLTIEEKVALVSGTDFMYTNSIPRLNISSIRMSDGPHGLRVQKEGGDNGVNGSEIATCFPPAVTIASSWNVNNSYKMGEAIAEEAVHYNINILLGPGVCIKRNPLCGRNFEYFSEDPYLAGKMALEEVKGVQSKNVGVCLKHFALNNAENYRFMGNSICDERAMREIYLKAFEIIVKEAKPHTLMCAYNKINGEYCSENRWLLTDVLRQEWGFDGVVMSDWGATHNRVKGIYSGLDLEMPGDTDICRKWLLDAIKNGSLKIEDLNKAVKNILELTNRYKDNLKIEEVDWEKHNKLAGEIAEDSAVLLKNDDVLPLKVTENILVVGDLFEKMRYQGAGSSMINPAFLSTPKMAFDDHKINYDFYRGYLENEIDVNKKLIDEVLINANRYDKILVFAGLTDYVESEGCDRKNMSLPSNQLELIKALIDTGKRVIVILYGGSPVELPFKNKVSAILNMYLPGQNGGNATYNLLFGIKSPCGKLAETWVNNYSDVQFGNEFSKSVNEIYKESIFVGYRYYLTCKKDVCYPFGYGLSYTKFDYSNINVEEENNEFKITCKITNVGKYDGAEIVQLYVKYPCGVFKPIKELKGFSKVYLKRNESKEVTIVLKKEDLKYWNIKENNWVMEGGEYELQICSDCSTNRLSKSVFIKGDNIKNPYLNEINEIYSMVDFSKVTNGVFEQMSGLIIPPIASKKPITLESRFTDIYSASLMVKILYNAVLSVAKKDMKQAKKLPKGAERDNKIKGALFLKRVLESNSIITMSMSGGKSFPYNFAEGFVNFANRHLFKGIKCFCKKIKVPELPKNKEKK